MKIQFKCRCGVDLECSIRKIGRSRICPNCLQEITVPIPSGRIVRDALQPLPVVVPGSSVASYSIIVDLIHQWAEVTESLASHSAHRDLCREINQGFIRLLRNIIVFSEDECRRELTKKIEVIDALASVAAGSTIAGVGTRQAKLRQYDRWRKANESGVSHPFSRRILGLIESLKACRRIGEHKQYDE